MIVDKQLFEGALETFCAERKGNGKETDELRKLKQKVQKKDEVISWLTEENIKLKKTFGNL